MSQAARKALLILATMFSIATSQAHDGAATTPHEIRRSAAAEEAELRKTYAHTAITTA